MYAFLLVWLFCLLIGSINLLGIFTKFRVLIFGKVGWNWRYVAALERKTITHLLKIDRGACRNNVDPVLIVVWIFGKILKFYSFLAHLKLPNLEFTRVRRHWRTYKRETCIVLDQHVFLTFSGILPSASPLAWCSVIYVNTTIMMSFPPYSTPRFSKPAIAIYFSCWMTPELIEFQSSSAIHCK